MYVLNEYCMLRMVLWMLAVSLREFCFSVTRNSHGKSKVALSSKMEYASFCDQRYLKESLSKIIVFQAFFFACSDVFSSY